MKAILYALLAAVFYAINIPASKDVHTHTITHTHGHGHFGADDTHSNRHPSAELERELGKT